MALIQISTSIAANSTDDNVLQGSQLEFLPFDARLLIGMNAAAIGLIINVFTGQDSIAENLIPLVKATAPIAEDFVLDDVAGGGQRMKISARNTTGAPIILLTSVRIIPIPMQ